MIEHNPEAAHALGWRLWRSEDPASTPFLLGALAPVLLTGDGQRAAVPKVTVLS